MQIAYLMNTYPVTSATFIRREIAALEAQGVSVRRFAVRPWDQQLVDDADRQEQTRTTYLLAPGGLRLVLLTMAESLRNPRGFWRAAKTAWTLYRNAGRGALVRHVAYLMEAVHLKRLANGCTHVHAHFSTNTAAVALLCARLGGPGYSFTAHGPDEFLDPGAASLGLKLQMARFAVAITEFARVQLALAGGMGIWPKLHVVRCGVDVTDLRPAPPPATDAPFVCVGRLCVQKAQEHIVAALADLHQTHPQARVILIGDGDTRPAITAAIARHGLGEHVELRGWADNAAVKDALSGARALLLPSFAEGLPIVIMEAHALGRPVISTYIAGIPELVDQQTGWLVPAGDVPALAAAMRACMDTPPEELASMGAMARARVEAAHDVTRNATDLKALFSRYV
ncbi:glycosyltransferase family 4 protein [Roseinatronobacter alkalisoli]|uniref:Glycosyltransferase family 4 protein n=1 Tax=Roseinatronobacter alkalisoli TaxID=3028235 RepID=A0ABT5T908_9RHOB|nr:glycosyltransferase family 4 protein [Roseinatronobacter sp. HJB301]MDD7971605.1 glycosyltransferase family 4 protein [Roseinatronobacter sp. HJB301]